MSLSRAMLLVPWVTITIFLYRCGPASAALHGFIFLHTEHGSAKIVNESMAGEGLLPGQSCHGKQWFLLRFFFTSVLSNGALPWLLASLVSAQGSRKWALVSATRTKCLTGVPIWVFRKCNLHDPSARPQSGFVNGTHHCANRLLIAPSFIQQVRVFQSSVIWCALFCFDRNYTNDDNMLFGGWAFWWGVRRDREGPGPGPIWAPAHNKGLSPCGSKMVEHR